MSYLDVMSNVLLKDQITFCISFVNQGPEVWRKSGETESKVFEVLCEVFAVYDDLGHQIMSVIFYHIKS